MREQALQYTPTLSCLDVSASPGVLLSQPSPTGAGIWVLSSRPLAVHSTEISKTHTTTEISFIATDAQNK